MDEQPPPDAARGAAAGALASLTSKAAMHPVDTVKAQMQVQGALAPGTRASAAAVARQILAAEGLPGLYRGLGAVVAGAGPAAGVYFGAVETARALAARLPPSPLTDAAVGVAAQLVAGVAFTPVDVVKERLQAARLTRARERSPLAAARAALAAAGPAGLLKGYWMTNAVWLPWGGLYFAGYEALKKRAGGGGRGEPLPAATQLAVGATAAAAASLATHPLDVVKTRVQVLAAGRGGATVRSVVRAALAAEGPSFLCAGAGPRAAALAGATSLQWLVYERARGWLTGGTQGRE